MDVSFINLLLQVPLAGVIVFITIKFLEHINQSNDKWLAVLNEQREANKNLFETLSDKIQKIAVGVEGTNSKVDKIEDRIANIELGIGKKSR